MPAGESRPYRLCVDNEGQIAGLQMKTYEPPPLGPNSVEVEVAAAALNFRDVMVALGLLPASAFERSALGREVGLEASGIVRRVGENVNVQAYRPGDEVIVMQGGCIANRLVVDQGLIVPKPARLNKEEAASSLSVYLTAYYALVHLARLRKGQRVLIHSAMGGVGQAAIALAKHIGAEIYATAGSESKRTRLLALGARAAFDSHSHGWHEELMAATDGEGVDVVLNSLSGRHVALCLQALRPGGCHCEIGKVDIYADNSLSLFAFRKNLRFVAIDMDRLMVDDPTLSQSLAAACLGLLQRGSVAPLPVTVFPYGEHAKAFRTMMGGQHEGKLVLKAPPASHGPEFPIADRGRLLDPDATYLVTGGLGGLGLRLLPYLVRVGARHLTLMDRDPERRRNVYWVRQSSTLAYMHEEAEIDIISGDVADEADVRRCVANLQRPLKGVFHLAGVLDDRLLADMSVEAVARVFGPKARGALNLHLATADHALDHFVLVSSISSTFGNPGQVNYSAANAFVDGLAACRRRQGLPALAYNLAAVAEAGMAARDLHVLQMMRAAGMSPVSSDFAITNLDYAMRRMSGCDHVITALFARVPWGVGSTDYMRIGRLMSNQDAFNVGFNDGLTLESAMARIADKVAELCGHDEGGMDEPLFSFGLNSVSVAELGAFIQSEFNLRVSALELMTTASCQSLAHAIVHGAIGVEEDHTHSNGESGEVTTPEVRQQQKRRRRPSQFASTHEDHFPPETRLNTDVARAPAVR